METVEQVNNMIVVRSETGSVGYALSHYDWTRTPDGHILILMRSSGEVLRTVR